MSERYVKIAVDEHQSAQLTCSARAEPPPSLTWYRNNYTLYTDVTKYLITESDDVTARFRHVSVLNVTTVGLDELGLYTCTAHNVLGSNVTRFNVTVRSKQLYCCLSVPGMMCVCVCVCMCVYAGTLVAYVRGCASGYYW